jgi:hypothetical protein
MTNFPNTGSTITPEPHQRTNSGLSTQIIVKVNETPIGALQNLTINQNRPLKRINEIGTDGNIEIVPQASTTYDLNVTRLVFDQLRLPEAFSRAFRFISAQRVPFDIDIYDMQGNVADDPSGTGLIVTSFTNCWFNTYSTPYTVDDYTVIETATIWAETAAVKNGGELFTPASLRTVNYQTDQQNIEGFTNVGARRGSLDAAGILNSLF